MKMPVTLWALVFLALAFSAFVWVDTLPTFDKSESTLKPSRMLCGDTGSAPPDCYLHSSR